MTMTVDNYKHPRNQVYQKKLKQIQISLHIFYKVFKFNRPLDVVTFQSCIKVANIKPVYKKGIQSNAIMDMSVYYLIN